MNISQGDLGMICTVTVSIVAIVTLVIGEVRRRTDRRGKVEERRIEQAADRAVSDNELRGVERAIDRLAQAQEKLNDRYRDHENECCEFRGRIEAEMELTRKTLEINNTALDQVRRQVSALMPSAGFAGLLAGDRKAAS